MRPLDFLGRIKAKLGFVILLAVAAAFPVNEYGRYLGVPGLVRMGVAGLISLAMAQLVGRGMTRPLRQMAAAAQTIAKGRYDLRVSATSRDEVGELARAFNAMAADLGEVDRQRRELVANVSHELRTPITGLQAVLENVIDGVSPPDRATLGTALAQTERLGRLVAQLLDLSRLDSGARLIEPELFDLASLCRQAVREARLTRDDVTVEYSVPISVTLFADPALLAQVLANLLDNAVRHSPAGHGVRLRARVTEQAVRISITDRGPGIPAAERSRVFERFSRLDSGRAADGGGAGLGLAIAKEIVEMHGGSLHAADADTASGVGCRMVIDLPRRLIVSDTSETPLTPPALEPAASVPSPHSSGGPETADQVTPPGPAVPEEGSPSGATRPTGGRAAEAVDESRSATTAAAHIEGGIAPPTAAAHVESESGPATGAAAEGEGETGPAHTAAHLQGEPGLPSAVAHVDSETGAAGIATDRPHGRTGSTGTAAAQVHTGPGPASTVGAHAAGETESAGQVHGEAGPAGTTAPHVHGGTESTGTAAAQIHDETGSAGTTASHVDGGTESTGTAAAQVDGEAGAAKVAAAHAVGETGAAGSAAVSDGGTASVPGTDGGTVPTRMTRTGRQAVPGGASAEDAPARPGAGDDDVSTREGSDAEPGWFESAAPGRREGEAAPERLPAERDLSSVDTLASGIPVAAVIGHDPRQGGSGQPPYGPPPLAGGPAGADGVGTLTGRTVLGGVLGLIGGFLVGIVLAVLAGVMLDSGGISLATLLFTMLGGMVLGSAIGQRTPSASQAAAPPRHGWPAGTGATGSMRTPTAPGMTGSPGATGGMGTAGTMGTGTAGTMRGPGTASRTGAASTGAGLPGNRRTPREQEYVPPPLFPRPDLPAAPSWLLAAGLVVGLVAAVALPYNPPGLGLVVVAVAMGLAVLPAARRRITPWSIAFGLVAYTLVAFTLFRDADWLVGPLLAAAFGLAALALSGGGRGWLGAVRGGLSVPLAVFQVPWFLSGPVKRLVLRRRLGPVMAGVGLTVGLVAVFAVLFSSADAVFSSLVSDLLQAPAWADSLPLRIFVIAVFAVLVTAAVLVALRPVADPVMPDLRLRVSRMLWAMPLIALNLLFAAFVTVQIAVLFGGNARVLSTAGLTYAEYARSGFFELVTVSVFVLAIVAAATGGLAVIDRGDRWRLGGLLGLLCGFTLIILVSALHRLDLYTDAYGLSRLRAVVYASIWWLAAVFVLVIVAGVVWLVRQRPGWLPRTLVLLTGLSLVAFAAWNPDLRIAESQHQIRGVDRIDQAYLRDLGSEAVPALDRLPEPLRSCVLRDVYFGNRLDRPEPSWGGWNLPREQARDLLRRRPLVETSTCYP